MDFGQPGSGLYSIAEMPRTRAGKVWQNRKPQKAHRRLPWSGLTDSDEKAPRLVQLIFTHVFGWTRGVWNAHLQL
jgi:hypothetical protein